MAKKKNEGYIIIDENGNDFFGKVEDYVNELLSEDNSESTGFFGLFKNFLNKLFINDKWSINDDNDYIKEGITNLIKKEFEIERLEVGETKKKKELNPKLRKEMIFSIKKTENYKIQIDGCEVFLRARIRKWLKPLRPEWELKTIILGTFPWVDTLNENLENPNICYYLNPTNIFWLILWIIYDNKFDDGKSKERVNPAIKTYLEINKKSKKSENSDISKWQQDFVDKVGNVWIRDAVHICYITPSKSKDESRVCLVKTGLDKDNYKILFNWKKNKLNKFVNEENTFGKCTKYTFCSSTSRASTSNQWLKLFNWAYHLLVDNDKNLEILDTVNSNLINLIKRYESKDDFVETLYSMMALFNIWYAYKRSMSFGEIINEIKRKNELEEDFFENLWKKLRDNVDLFLTWETDDEDDKKNNENDDIK